MAESTYPPFFKWGDCKSTDSNNPDVLEVKVTATDTFDTEYTTNIQCAIKRDSGWQESILPLKSHDSRNASLLKLWAANVKSGRIKANTQLRINTWLGKSKKSQWTIRRFAIQF